MGFKVASSADFPIHFSVGSMQTQFDTRVPSKRDGGTLGKEYQIPPKGVGFHQDSEIKLGGAVTALIEGKIVFKVTYRRSGSRKKAVFEKSQRLYIRPGIDELLSIEHFDVV